MAEPSGARDRLLASLVSNSRFLGVVGLVVALYAALMASNPNAHSVQNHQILANRLGFYGVLTFGVGLLIISGGIDLSIGSVVGLSAVGFARLLSAGVGPVLAICIVLAGTAVVGLINGLLITGLRLQPFLVTLCGLFAYRGIARQLSDKSIGLSDAAPSLQPEVYRLRELVADPAALGGLPGQLLIMLAVAGLFALIMHASVYGRYLYAIGHNEQAARYAGIPVNRYKVFAYVWCAVLAGGVGGILEMFEVETATPSNVGTLYELYAITGAVLGGCTLSGGEGNVIGILFGTAVLPLLRSNIQFWRIPNEAEYTIIGVALLLGTIADELFKRRARRRGA
jgi:ribose transport system permease protein